MDKNSQSSPYRIMLVGCGKMGSAMLKAWLTANIVSEALVIDPCGLPEIFKNDPRVQHHEDASQGVTNQPDAVILATKPQTLRQAAEDISGSIKQDCLILSIAAGQSLETLQNLFSKGQPIVRTMPNTPAAIGKGMSVAIANPQVRTAQEEIVSHLLGATGQLEWIKNEDLMDAVTALSGSGPAYIFMLIEVLAKAGEKLDLPKDIAMKLARQTIIGSAALAEVEKDTPASTLRENVTSPGGTTAAALEILMNGELQEIYNKALAKARSRAEELNS